MSLLQATDVDQSQAKKTDRKPDFGFVIVICAALSFAAIAAVFNPVPIGSGLSNDTVFVGP